MKEGKEWIIIVSKSKPNKNFILSLLFAGWLLDYLDRMVMSVAVVAIANDFSLEPAAIGAVISSFFAGYALMQIPGGWLSDKFGSRRILIFSIVAWSVFTVLSGLAWSLISLLVIRFLFGMGRGLSFVKSKSHLRFLPEKGASKSIIYHDVFQ